MTNVELYRTIRATDLERRGDDAIGRDFGQLDHVAPQVGEEPEASTDRRQVERLADDRDPAAT